MTSLTPGMMRLVGKKHHLVTVRRNIRLTITYYHPTYSFSPGVMRLGNTKCHLPTVKRNIRLTITYFFSHIYLARVAKLMTKSFWPLCISLACNKEMTGNRKISRKD